MLNSRFMRCAHDIRGLPVTPDEHYLLTDSATDFAEALVRLIEDRLLRNRLSRQARDYVEARFSSHAVDCFDGICSHTLDGER